MRRIKCSRDRTPPTMARLLCLLLAVVCGSLAQIDLCDPSPCATNAECFLDKGVVVCECVWPYKGNGWRKCCHHSDPYCCLDPHCKTNDGTFYDYQGTCPYIFSKPCKHLDDPDKNYVVKAKNAEFYPNSPVAYVSEIEVEMHGHKIYVNETLGLKINGANTKFPYYFPSKEDAKLVVERRGVAAYIRNIDHVSVTFYKQILKMQIPHLDEYIGRDGLCGLAGNINKNCSDDIIGIDGEGLVQPGCVYPVDKKNMARVATVLDTWRTDEFEGWDHTRKCRTGLGVAPELPQCDASVAEKTCFPLKQAIDGAGPFGACKAMGKEAITKLYESCLFDGCVLKNSKCTTFQNFAESCQGEIQNADLTNWRRQTACPQACPPGSLYKASMSGCQPTCADRTPPARCNKPNLEGCQCNAGLFLDESANPPKCVAAFQCPACYDENGAGRVETETWFTNDCKQSNTCRKGEILINPRRKCTEHAFCGLHLGVMGCECESGYKFDNSNPKRCVPK